MDTYRFWTARAMTKLAQAKEADSLSSSGITKASTAFAVTRSRSKFVSQELH